MKTRQTILALDPGLRDLGYAVLCGRELVDAGVRTFRFVPKARRHAQALASVRAWLTRYAPDVLVLETTPGDHEPTFAALRGLERSIKGLSRRRKLPCVLYPPQAARKTLLGNGWASKDEAAASLAARYPTVRIFLRQNRRWKERYFRNLFDAVGLAIHHQAVAA